MNHRNKRKFWFPFFPLLMIVMSLVLGLIVMLLWNSVLSPVLHISNLSYWQAVGLFILSRILFGGFRRGSGFEGKPGWRGNPPWRRKWMNMSEEERTKFREEWNKRCKPPETKQE